mmetsp:Transcript_110536/g.226145  ORF Transcript_110536/g.226145 Transcript_110536/m.226145 type:complete len:212 (-) Transcript_110536:936-1571(-)
MRRRRRRRRRRRKGSGGPSTELRRLQQYVVVVVVRDPRNRLPPRDHLRGHLPGILRQGPTPAETHCPVRKNRLRLDPGRRRRGIRPETLRNATAVGLVSDHGIQPDPPDTPGLLEVPDGSRSLPVVSCGGRPTKRRGGTPLVVGIIVGLRDPRPERGKGNYPRLGPAGGSRSNDGNKGDEHRHRAEHPGFGEHHHQDRGLSKPRGAGTGIP